MTAPRPKVKEQKATKSPTSRHAEAPGRIGAVADDRAGENRGADVVGDGVGGEGGEARRTASRSSGQDEERDPVVPGERRIGERGRSEAISPARRRNRGERLAQARIGEAAQFPEQHPGRYGHRPEADDRPCDVLNPLHALACPLLAGHAPASPSLPEQNGEGKAGAARFAPGAAARRSTLAVGARARPWWAKRSTTGESCRNARPHPPGRRITVGDPRNDTVLISVNGALTSAGRGEGLRVRFRLRARRRRLGGAAARRRTHRVPRPASRSPVGRGENAPHRHRPRPRRDLRRGSSTSSKPTA